MSRFPFNPEKATDVAGMFLEKANGSMNILKLVKLFYLLDRRSIEKRGIPVVGGWYLSMKHGPVTSEVLNLVNGGTRQNGESRWESLLSDRANHRVKLSASPGVEFLSESEIGLISEVFEEFGKMNRWDLVDWCHKHLEEWTPLDAGREEITVTAMGRALGLDEEACDRIAANARECSFVTQAISK